MLKTNIMVITRIAMATRQATIMMAVEAPLEMDEVEDEAGPEKVPSAPAIAKNDACGKEVMHIWLFFIQCSSLSDSISISSERPCTT